MEHILIEFRVSVAFYILIWLYKVETMNVWSVWIHGYLVKGKQGVFMAHKGFVTWTKNSED